MAMIITMMITMTWDDDDSGDHDNIFSDNYSDDPPPSSH